MPGARSGQPRRLLTHEIDRDIAAGADYAGGFEVAAGDVVARSPEQWARDTFEGAPAPVRWFTAVGWRRVLGLRLGPASTTDHIAGWTIVQTVPGAVTVEARSRWLTARKMLSVDPPRVTLATSIHYERWQARVLWLTVSPVHHQLEPYLLRRAAARS